MTQGAANNTAPLNVSGRQRSVMRKGVVHEVAPFKIFEVMENDLLTFESTTNEERLFSAFSTFFAGIVVPLIIQWPVGEASVAKLALHYGGTFTCALGFLVFGILALIWRKKRRTSIETLHRNPKQLAAPSVPADPVMPAALAGMPPGAGGQS